MLRVKSFSSLCLRRGGSYSSFQETSLCRSVHSFRTVHPWSQILNKQSWLKFELGPVCLRRHICFKRFYACGGIAAVGVFAGSINAGGVLSQAQEDGGSSAQSQVVWDEDLSPLFVWLRRLWVPLLMGMTIVMGWHYPLSMCINLLFLFWSTKPTPSSIYMWVEQKRLQAAARVHGLSRLKTQLSNATMMTHVEVHDYGIACVARVSSLSQRMLVVGALGDWWVLYSCSSSISGLNVGSWFPTSSLDQ